MSLIRMLARPQNAEGRMPGEQVSPEDMAYEQKLAVDRIQNQMQQQELESPEEIEKKMRREALRKLASTPGSLQDSE